MSCSQTRTLLQARTAVRKGTFAEEWARGVSFSEGLACMNRDEGAPGVLDLPASDLIDRASPSEADADFMSASAHFGWAATRCRTRECPEARDAPIACA